MVCWYVWWFWGSGHAIQKFLLCTGDNFCKDTEQFLSWLILVADEYRRRIFFNYERRLRLRSPPEKVDNIPTVVHKTFLFPLQNLSHNAVLV